MKKLLSFCLILCLLLPLTGCGDPTAPKVYTFFAMDTVLTVTLYGDNTAALARGASEIAADIEKKASATLADSEVSHFNAVAEAYEFSSEMAEILTLALEMCQATEGAYDITVAPLVSLWNIKEGGPVPEQEAIDEALEKVSYETLTLTGNVLTKSDPTVTIDLGSVAKGYALGKMADFLTEAGAAGIVNFGGNVALVGEKPDGEPWRVSLRDPFDRGGVMGTLTLSRGVVAVSGDYERYFEEGGVRYHHILSPFDGYPASGVHSVAIYSENATEADLLSTALFVMGEAGAKAFYEKGEYDFSYIMVLADGSVVTSPDLDTIYQSTME